MLTRTAGWSSVIGILPVIGDVLDGMLALLVIRTASAASLPNGVLLHMLFNVAIDFVLGLVPFLGDIADMAYKANTRNALVLEDYLRQRGRENLRKSGMPLPVDLSLADDDYEEGTVDDRQPIAQPQPTYGGSSRGYAGGRREYDPESHRGERSVGHHGSSNSKQKSSKSGRDRSHREKSSRGHTRLLSQETGTTDPGSRR